MAQCPPMNAVALVNLSCAEAETVGNHAAFAARAPSSAVTRFAPPLSTDGTPASPRPIGKRLFFAKIARGESGRRFRGEPRERVQVAPHVRHTELGRRDVLLCLGSVG